MSILAECLNCKRKQKIKNKKCKCGQNLDKAKKAKKVKYWINYRLPDKTQRREAVSGKGLSPYSIEDARIFESKRKIQKKENRILDVKKESQITFEELSKWFLSLEKVKRKAYFPTLKYNLASFNEIFGEQMINTIKAVDLENYQEMRKKENLSDSYIDQQIGAARTMINKAFENDIINGEALRTFKKIKKLLKKNSNARDRIITLDEFESLLVHLPRHTKAICKMAYYTGMRKGEILSLKWEKVDLKNRFINLEAEDTKDREKRSIPICDELLTVLKNIPKHLYTDYVFIFRSRPINDIRYGLKKACKKVGIPYGRNVKDGFTFHDLRHSFNTNMRKAGVQESVIMGITGHSTREMFDRYNSVDKNDKIKAVDQLEVFLRNVDPFVDLNKKGIQAN